MELNEIATKADLEKMKQEIIDTIMKAVKPLEMDSLLSLKKASDYLGDMSPQTIRQKACSGEIASHLAGGLKFTKKDLNAYIKSTRRPSNAEILAKS